MVIDHYNENDCMSLAVIVFMIEKCISLIMFIKCLPIILIYIYFDDCKLYWMCQGN